MGASFSNIPNSVSKLQFEILATFFSKVLRFLLTFVKILL